MNEMNFEVGDRVWSFKYKDWGKVVDIDEDEGNYPPIQVEFQRESTQWCETDDVFFEEIVIPPSARVRPKPKHDLKIDDRVLVRDTGDEDWSKRHFAGWTDHGRMTTFLEGSSWTACGDTVAWDEWKLPDADSEKSEVKNDE